MIDAQKTLSVEDYNRQKALLQQVIGMANTRLKSLERLCPHEWVYSRDPSGNNDSGWFCEMCGRTSRSRPEGQ